MFGWLGSGNVRSLMGHQETATSGSIQGQRRSWKLLFLVWLVGGWVVSNVSHRVFDALWEDFVWRSSHGGGPPVAGGSIGVAAPSGSSGGSGMQDDVTQTSHDGQRASGASEADAGRIKKISVVVADQRRDAQTEKSLEKALTDELRKEAQELAGRAISFGQAIQEYLWLRQQNGVRLEQREDRDPLTGRVTIHADLCIPVEIVARWVPELRARSLKRERTLLGGMVATAGVWLLSFVGAVVGDRITGGYRRAWLIPGTFLTATAVTVAGWWYVYAAILSAR